MEYRIPEGQKNALKTYLTLQQEDVNQLISEIEKIPAGMKLEQIFEELLDTVKIAHDELRSIISMLFSLHHAKNASGISAEEFNNGILSAIEYDADLKESISETTRKNLKRILNIEGPFLSTIKAIELARERERLALNTRIITDIRPLIDEKNTLLGSIVIHDLRILYQEGEQTKEAHFAIDSSDLRQLREAIEKAEADEKLIRETFSSSKHNFIEVD